MKELYCERANELSWELYDKDFCDLSQELQEKVWLQAEQDVVEGFFDHADNLRKAKKEGL